VRRLLRFLRKVLLFSVIAWVALATLGYFAQRKMQYRVDAEDAVVPTGDRYRTIEEVRIETSDGIAIRAWYWPGPRDTTLWLFHGNAGHRGHRLGWMEHFHRLGWPIFMHDYRGYGGSGGEPTEAGFYLDTDACAEFLKRRGVDRFVVFGESLGCNVAIDAAARYGAVGAIMQSGAPSLLEVGKRMYFFMPVEWGMQDTFLSEEKAATITVPVLSIHGTEDRLIPIEMGRRLNAAFGSQDKEFYEIRHAGHGVLRSAGPAYVDRLHNWLERISHPKPATLAGR